MSYPYGSQDNKRYIPIFSRKLYKDCIDHRIPFTNSTTYYTDTQQHASVFSPVVAQSLNKPVDQCLSAGTGFRNLRAPFDPIVDCAAGSEIVQCLRHLDSALKVYSPSSPNYEALRSVYNKQITARPQAICRPTTVAQVQAIVRASTELGVPLAVRAIGHAFFGQSCVADSVMLDMREMDSLTLFQRPKDH